MDNWKTIEGVNDKYMVSDKGEVKSLFFKEPRNLKASNTKNGYKSVSLQIGKTVKKKYVHRLVAENFLIGKGVVNHIDGDKTNNRATNLEWCTSSQNNQHAWDTGLVSKEKRSKLEREDVDRIRGLHAMGINPNQVAITLNLPKNPVYSVCQGRTWKDYQIMKPYYKEKSEW